MRVQAPRLPCPSHVQVLQPSKKDTHPTGHAGSAGRMQLLLAQSESAAQSLEAAHGSQLEPPQSTSVSS
jgi:hypothetical protein